MKEESVEARRARETRNSRVREKTCYGKTPYFTQRDARHGLKRLKGSSGYVESEQGVPMSPYRCPFCSSWHIGHIPSMRALEDLAATIRDLPV